MSIYKSKTIATNVILEHYDTPTHKIENEADLAGFKKFENKSSTCIDNITVYLKIEDEIITKAVFAGVGCAISVASTDILCGMIENKPIEEGLKILDNYIKMINQEPYDEEILEELLVFYNIPNQPNRIKCSKMGYTGFAELLAAEKKEDNGQQ